MCKTNLASPQAKDDTGDDEDDEDDGDDRNGDGI